MLSMVRCFSMSNFFICFQFDCVICFQFDCVLSDEFLLLIFLRVAQKRLCPPDLLQKTSGLNDALRKGLLRGKEKGIDVDRAGAVHLLGRCGHTRIGHTKPRPVEDAVLGIGADGRADAAVPSRSVGFRGPAKCRAGTCAADARRTVALSRAETTALGSERTSGAGAHRLELRLGRARGVTEDWALDRVSPHLAILARDPRARNVHMLVERSAE